jgi:hypothetical protein
MRAYFPHSPSAPDEMPSVKTLFRCLPEKPAPNMNSMDTGVLRKIAWIELTFFM